MAEIQLDFSKIDSAKKLPRKPLIPDLVPKAFWGQSLSNTLDMYFWTIIRRKVYSYYGMSCACCKRDDRPLYCHEDYDYYLLEDLYIQRLVDFISLCDYCSDAVHAGRTIAIRPDLRNSLIQYIADVNGICFLEAETMVEDSLDNWTAMSMIAASKVPFIEHTFLPILFEKYKIPLKVSPIMVNNSGIILYEE